MDLECRRHVNLLLDKAERVLLASIRRQFHAFLPRLPNDARRLSANSAEARLMCAPTKREKKTRLISKQIIEGVVGLFLAVGNRIYILQSRTNT